MHSLRLLPHISFALVGERAVFLDLLRDRYFALDGSSAAAFDMLRSSANGCLNGELTQTLLATGLFAPTATPQAYLSPQPPAPDGALLDDGAKPAMEDVIRILFLVLRTRHEIRSRPLEQVIARRRCRQRNVRSVDEFLALAQRFQRARTLVPVTPTCLQDSLALYDWLTARGACSTLVFGVQLAPFAAHCWVQLGGTVLNDAPDRVMSYTPILVVD